VEDPANAETVSMTVSAATTGRGQQHLGDGDEDVESYSKTEVGMAKLSPSCETSSSTSSQSYRPPHSSTFTPHPPICHLQS